MMYVSPAMSIQMLLVETTNGITTYPNQNNTLYCQNKPLGYFVPTYQQKWNTCDIVTIQFQSEQSVNTVKVYDTENVEQLELTVNKVVDNQNGQIPYAGFLVDLGVSNSYVYFDSPIMPLDIGDNVTISTIDTYEVLDVYYFALLNKYVAEIDRVSSVQNIEVTLNIDTGIPYDIYEAVLDWSEIGVGTWQVKIESVVDEETTITYVSEWQSVKVSHEQTHLLQWSQSTQDVGIDYSTGIVNQMRVPSYFYKRFVSGDQNSYQDGDTVEKVGSKNRRNARFEITSSPAWLHEKVCLALSHDLFTINGVEHQSSELYEPEYKDLFSLASGAVNLERLIWSANIPVAEEEIFVNLATSQGYFMLLDNGDFLRIHLSDPMSEFTFATVGVYTTLPLACVGGGIAINIYNHVDYLGLGSRVYATSLNRSIPPTNGWYTYESMQYHIVDGLVINVQACITQFEHELINGAFANATEACDSVAGTTTFYSEDSTLIIGSVIYVSSFNPSSTAIAGWYKQPSLDRSIELNSGGEIITITACVEYEFALTTGATQIDSCNSISETTYYTQSVTLGLGAILYTASGNPASIVPDAWYTDISEVEAYRTVSGEIVETQTCL